MFTSEECCKGTEKEATGQDVFINSAVTAADVTPKLLPSSTFPLREKNYRKSYAQGAIIHLRQIVKDWKRKL